MKDEWWLTAAISDDTLVAELLLRLKDTSSPPPHPSSYVIKPLPMTWGCRQPRSSVEKKKDASATHQRRSPTTPLSFSFSAGDAACCDDSSAFLDGGAAALPLSSDRFRSKISASTETPTTTGKRPRRKKTFAELKEEEGSLLKERIYLKKELATLRLTLKEQRSINENLKRIKLDLQVESGVKSEANSTSQNGESEAASSNISRHVKREHGSEPDSGRTQTVGSSQQEPVFVLPDLNMMPDDGIAGMS